MPDVVPAPDWLGALLDARAQFPRASGDLGRSEERINGAGDLWRALMHRTIGRLARTTRSWSSVTRSSTARRCSQVGGYREQSERLATIAHLSRPPGRRISPRVHARGPAAHIRTEGGERARLALVTPSELSDQRDDLTGLGRTARPEPGLRPACGCTGAAPAPRPRAHRDGRLVALSSRGFGRERDAAPPPLHGRGGARRSRRFGARARMRRRRSPRGLRCVHAAPIGTVTEAQRAPGGALGQLSRSARGHLRQMAGGVRRRARGSSGTLEDPEQVSEWAERFGAPADVSNPERGGSRSLGVARGRARGDALCRTPVGRGQAPGWLRARGHSPRPRASALPRRSGGRARAPGLQTAARGALRRAPQGRSRMAPLPPASPDCARRDPARQ